MSQNKNIKYIAEKLVKNLYDAVLFDMDGTLVDSMWMWGVIDREYLARFGILSPSDIEDKIAGMSMKEVAAYFQVRFGITDSASKMISDWEEMSAEKYRYEVSLKPGVREFLLFLKERKIPFGIGTSNNLPNTEACLKANGVLDWFSAIGSSENITKGKPSPEIYLFVAKKIGRDPKKCLCFDDIPPGIMAGKAAGMDSVAIFDENTKHLDKEKHELSDAYINGFEELMTEINILLEEK